MKPHLVSAAHVKYPPRHTKDVYEFFDETGMKQLGKVRLVPAGMSGWYLADFMIYKRFRGKGHSKTLMDCVLKLAKRKRKKSIFLWVEKTNAAAIKV